MSHFLAILAVLGVTGAPACDKGGEVHMYGPAQVGMPSGLTPLYRPGLNSIETITPDVHDRNTRQDEQDVLLQYLELHAQALADADPAALMFWWRLHPVTVADGREDPSRDGWLEPMSAARASNACS